MVAVAFLALASCDMKSGSSPSTAGGTWTDRWTVTAVSGPTATWRADGGAWQALTVGTVIGPADGVRSGSASTATLERMGDVMVVAENTEISVAPQPARQGFTRILQSIGNLLLRVEKRPDQKFEVKTPYLTATVKGTRFDVTVGDTGSTVSVAEGVVGVSSEGGGSVDVVPGQTANVAAAAGQPITVSPTPPGQGPKSLPPSKQSGKAPASPPGKAKGQGKGNNAANGNNAADAGGNGNSGGNGNGNSGGNGNGNSGGNGNGNSGGNGNAGGNGKGNGKGNNG